MTVTTLPRMAVDIDATGHAWYPFTTGIDDAVLFAAEPELPLPSFRWAELPADDRPHITLDVQIVAELLFTSKLHPDDGPTNELLCATVVRQLEGCRCNLRCCAADMAAEFGDHPQQSADRMTWCLELAARIVRTEATA